jgi:hypothetical protein
VGADTFSTTTLWDNIFKGKNLLFSLDAKIAFSCKYKENLSRKRDKTLQ